MPVERKQVWFDSAGTGCAAWLYPGSNGACVVMAAGMAVTSGPGTDRFARRFWEAGFTVLAFDYRRLGRSGGEPRQVVRLQDERADWDAAIAFARGVPGVDPARIAVWGFSSSGGHVFRVAAAHPELAAAIAQTPNADGPAAARNAMRYQRPAAMVRLLGRGLLDSVGGWFGLPPRLVALDGAPGTVALLTTPDAQDSRRALNPDNQYPDWQQVVAARAALQVSLYRPGRSAGRVRCPLLVVVCDQDQSALAGPAVRAARRAPHGELLRLPGGHYAPFLDQYERTVDAELAFLLRHVVDRPVRPVAPARGQR
jgi:uncharacterized protein